MDNSISIVSWHLEAFKDTIGHPSWHCGSESRTVNSCLPNHPASNVFQADLCLRHDPSRAKEKGNQKVMALPEPVAWQPSRNCAKSIFDQVLFAQNTKERSSFHKCYEQQILQIFHQGQPVAVAIVSPVVARFLWLC